MNVKVYQDAQGREPFLQWLASLRDVTTRRRIQKRVRRVELGNLGDFAPVGEGVHELRLHFGAGYRIYYGSIDDHTILLLTGGDKTTQARDIQRAHTYWAEHKRS